MVDAITTQVVRNRIGSLMQEMHYHFYRSGYSTIIRESRDFSCVILDRHGGLLVAPPMFFHAPVYRHLVAKIFELHGDDIGAVGIGGVPVLDLLMQHERTPAKSLCGALPFANKIALTL